MLEIRHLKTLHALREADSLVEAAERLHLTQSALSHQFKELEERLGMQLFVRKTKPLRFTSAGLRLLQLADATLPLLRGAERDIARLAGGTAGRLHMAIECHSCFQWLMPTIDAEEEAQEGDHLQVRARAGSYASDGAASGRGRAGSNASAGTPHSKIGLPPPHSTLRSPAHGLAALVMSPMSPATGEDAPELQRRR